jgi:ubiquinone/menaquinone biosynthesis C-methylase UbiE
MLGEELGWRLGRANRAPSEQTAFLTSEQVMTGSIQHADRPKAGQDKDSERAYYDQLFKKRGRFDQFKNDIYGRIAAEARRGTAGNLAVELGCGSGVQAGMLMEQGFTVTALDLSIEATRVARRTVAESGRTLAVINGDAEHLPIKSGSVDACVCGLLLHHFTRLDGVASEIRRIMKPGGVVIAIDANGYQPFAFLFFNVIHRLRPLRGLTPNQRAIRPGEIREVFARHGFGNFEFDSLTSQLRRDWLGTSLRASLNYYTRAAVLGLSKVLLPRVAQGNMLLSSFRRLPDGATESVRGGANAASVRNQLSALLVPAIASSELAGLLSFC